MTRIGSSLLAMALVACAGMTAGQVATTVTADLCELDALAGAVIPAGTPAATVAADVQLACPLAKGVEALVLAFIAEQADAGTAPAGTAYVPSPLVQRARAKAHR